MDVSDIPAGWRAALAALQVLRPEAIMAGGCLRDRETGVKVKDIDVFVYGKTPDDARRFRQQLEREGWKAHDADAKTYGSDKRPMFAGVIDVDYPGIPLLQIIVGEWTHENLLADFDFGICQIMFDGKTITRTHQYRADRAARQFRLTPQMVSNERFERSVERFARLKAKYPEWSFRLPYATGGLVSPERLFAGIDLSAIRSQGEATRQFGTVTGRMVVPGAPDMWQMPKPRP